MPVPKCWSKPLIELTPTDRSAISRWRSPPAFDFVEHAIATGQGYRWGREGYVLVGGDDSLLPGFIVELSSPKRPWIDACGLIDALCQISCGAIWFDSEDHDAFDLVRRSGRPAHASALLLACVRPSLPKRFGSSLIVRPCSPSDELQVVSLMSQASPELGGVSPERACKLLANGEIYGAYRGDDLVAAATVSAPASGWVSVGVIVTAPEARTSMIGVRFMNSLLRALVADGWQISAGVGTSNVFAFEAGLKLGMAPVRQSWTALLADSLKDS